MTTVKPLEWRFWPNGFPPFGAGTAGKLGYYTIEEVAPSDDDEEADEDMRDAHLIDPCHRRATGYAGIISFILFWVALYLLLARDGGGI